MSGSAGERERRASAGGAGRCRAASPRATRPRSRERRPRGQPEVGVDDVEALAAGSGGAARAPRAGTRRRRPGANANSSTSTPSIRRSAATWSRTKLPERRARRAAGPCSRRPARARARRAYRGGPAGTWLWHHAARCPRSLEQPGRRVRLRRRRAHRAARAARRSCPNEDFLYLGDTARFPYGERSAATSSSVRARDRRAPARRGARSCSWSPATRRARRRSDALERMHLDARGRDVDVIGVVAPAAQLAVARQPHRPHRAAGDARDGRQRRLRAGGARPPTRTCTWRASPARTSRRSSSTASRSTSSVVETVRGYCAPLREADVDTVILGCTHYPLIAPMLQRMLGPRRDAGHLGRGRRAQRRARARRARGLLNPRAGEGDYRFLCTGDVDVVPRARHALPADAARARSSTSSSGSRWRHDATRRERSYGRAPDAAAAGRRSSPASCRTATGSALISVGRDAGDLHRLGRGRRAALAGGLGPRLGHRRVRDAARLDRRAQAARRQHGPRPTGARSRSSG